MHKLIVAAILFFSPAFSAFSWNVFMVGDSHVCSRIYPESVERIICAHHPDVNFSFWGKIGAGFYTYNESPQMMDHIYEAEPDILIVHLGTNDSFTKRFVKKNFLKDVKLFFSNVRAHLPECKIVFVTPFFNILKGSKTPNRNTRACADALLSFTEDKFNTYVVDNNAQYGKHFLDNRADLMRHDCVHLTEKGYEELGNQVGHALLEMEDLWLIGEPPYLEHTSQTD